MSIFLLGCLCKELKDEFCGFWGSLLNLFIYVLRKDEVDPALPLYCMVELRDIACPCIYDNGIDVVFTVTIMKICITSHQ
jgi:hypothetical protein